MNSQWFDTQLLNVPVLETGEVCVGPYQLRKSVAEALEAAAKYFLALGYILVVKSAYRSLSEQKIRFIKRYVQFKEVNPGVTKKALLSMANTYTAGIPILAAHCAGAAVDVILLGDKGNPLDFGALYPHGGPEAGTDFEDLPPQVKKNRQLLKSGMEKFGFANYPFEYWHYSMGDVCAAYIKGEPHAIYGPIELGNELSKDDWYTYFQI